jgi:hypothetical protein
MTPKKTEKSSASVTRNSAADQLGLAAARMSRLKLLNAGYFDP